MTSEPLSRLLPGRRPVRGSRPQVKARSRALLPAQTRGLSPPSREPGEDESEAAAVPRPRGSPSSPPSGDRGCLPFRRRPFKAGAVALALPLRPAAPDVRVRAREGCHSGQGVQGKPSGNGIGSLERDQMAGLTQPDPRCRSCSRGARLTAGQVSPLPGWVTEARARPHRWGLPLPAPS